MPASRLNAVITNVPDDAENDDDGAIKKNVRLTAKQVADAKPRDKEYKLKDTESLYLTVSPAGSKWWRFRYRFRGNERRTGLGTYPAVSLKEARTRRDEIRALAHRGIDPREETRRAQAKGKVADENTFQQVATLFIASRTAKWTASYRVKLQRSLEADVFPHIGSKPIREITRTELLACLKRIETERGAIDMARRVCQRCSMVFKFAIDSELCEHNIARDLPGSLSHRKVRHYSALRATDLPEFMAAMLSYEGEQQTKLAMRLLLLTFVRTNELRFATWDEMSFELARWEIPAERMKARETHVVPLSTQALEILKELKAQNVDGSKYVLPQAVNARKPMSENTILFALYRMGYKGRTTGHGFRTLASTTLNEARFPPDAVEAQLAHREPNSSRAAYNRASWLLEREVMMQAWADYLDHVGDLAEATRALRIAARKLD
ncbi:tyrosine-type recombinase/integrase [Luteibacter rhizovicinus]|uniref:tyrosine-type recombinase/integrase n=1 Tax=Luteibacter rhizovicinus TaxID=242606 RepID=UPI00098F30B4|nr:integrase arm-type DNA-binding domain-containing protein [Luteibacter rhizovicinus]